MDLPELQKLQSEARVIEAKAPSMIASTLKYLKAHGPAIGAVIGSIVCVFTVIKLAGT